ASGDLSTGKSRRDVRRHRHPQKAKFCELFFVIQTESRLPRLPTFLCHSPQFSRHISKCFGAFATPTRSGETRDSSRCATLQITVVQVSVSSRPQPRLCVPPCRRGASWFSGRSRSPGTRRR